jgi:3-oxoacyl-[acyl-carrier protein] reductase
MKKPLSLQNSIVTGVSRKKGIGTAICYALADAGANIFFTSWQRYDAAIGWAPEPDLPENLATELRQKKVSRSTR